GLELVRLLNVYTYSIKQYADNSKEGGFSQRSYLAHDSYEYYNRWSLNAAAGIAYTTKIVIPVTFNAFGVFSITDHFSSKSVYGFYPWSVNLGVSVPVNLKK